MGSKPWHGPKWPEDVPYEISSYEKPLTTVLDTTARLYPDHTYTIFEGATRTFAQVKDTADRVAHFLVSRGIEPGDRVAIFLPNVPHYPPIFFGILEAGGVCVTCNPLYKVSELKFQLKDAGVKALFVMDHPMFYPTALKAMEGSQVDTVVVCNVRCHLPPIKGFLGSLLGKIPKAEHHEPGHLMFDDLIKSTSPAPPERHIKPTEDLALILYTGGTTGLPKGACLTHANLVSNLMMSEEYVRLVEKPGEKPKKLEKGVHTTLGLLPWYHSYGLTHSLLASCERAARLVCIPDPRAGKPPFTEVLKAIEKYKVTGFGAVPTIFSALVNHPLIDQFDLTSLMGCGSGAAPLPLEVLKQFEERTGAVIYEGYGLTETSPTLTSNPTNQEQRKIGSVGLPLPSTDIKIVDLESGLQELPQGEDGEIAVSGPQVMLGYWNKPEENRAVFREINGNRFFLTGDIGHIDEEGFLVITDRKKDMIIVGGFNAYPREIEEVLYTHPKVALAAVIGVPDPHRGEAVKAFVQLKPGTEATEEEFIAFCKTRMAGYKRPREIEFRETLPTSMVGKVLRRVLREKELEKRKGT
ncbi:MAG: long-chain fatty acid--CoA ligase [Deltaproteobacteria bacterium]|nr:MAG: long-chain fatty acid--CoA ligase [Deltaproteobacteria bacterium]